MPVLYPYPCAPQETANSCWASAGRSIANWYRSIGAGIPGGPFYGSDQAFADAWATAADNPAYSDINTQESASAALGDLGFDNNTDDRAFPTAAEIYDSINIGSPLLAAVASAPPNPNPNLACSNAPWVVVIGISGTQDSATIHVFDPADGQVHTEPYSDTIYQPDVYWQNTSYVSEYSPDPQTGDEGAEAGDMAARRPARPAPAAESTPALTPVPAPAIPPTEVSPWTCEARGSVQLRVDWTAQDNGASVQLTIAQTGGPGDACSYQTVLGFAPGMSKQGIWQLGGGAAALELTLTLSQAPAAQGGTAPQANLWASYPLTQAEGVHKVIASWPIGAPQA